MLLILLLLLQTLCFPEPSSFPFPRRASPFLADSPTCGGYRYVSWSMATRGDVSVAGGPRTGSTFI